MGKTINKRAPDFSGYATKAGIVCTDGRMIDAGAFAHQDGQKVPMVWQHGHKDVENVLGHVFLEERDSTHPDGAGTYCYGYFNDTAKAAHAQKSLDNGDFNALSIWANQLKEKIAGGIKHVLGGGIKEVSLALAGANSGAVIDNIRVAHSDNPDDPNDPEGIETLADEAFIVMHMDSEPASPPEETEEEEESEEESTEGDEEEGTDLGHANVKEVWEGMSEDQRALVGVLVNEALQHDDNDEGEHLEHQEGTEVTHKNLFESVGHTRNPGMPASLQHDGLDKRWDGSKAKELLHSAMGQWAGAPGMSDLREGTGVGSFKKFLEEQASEHLGHAVDYGIENIDYLFPDARMVQDVPQWIKRETEWVSGVLAGVTHSPFSRIKTMTADITADEARAKGYVQGAMKKEEWFSLSKRTTGPATIYKKQKLDRDDILDITDFDVVAWMKSEMRLMLDEEIARAILVGDGREIDDEDKIAEPNSGDNRGIRPIAFDDDLYTHKVQCATNATVTDKVETILRARKYYKGSGSPTLYTTDDVLTDFLLETDRMGRRLYPTEADVAVALRVKNIVTVEVMEGVQTEDGELIGLIVNLRDYTVGADKGAAIGLFDDFDIDFNQYKYLIETRISGALTRYKSAIAILRANGTEVTPGQPTFDEATGVVTIPSTANVTYKNDETNATLSSGAQAPLDQGEQLHVRAYANSGYYLPHNFDSTWSFVGVTAL
jgi:hypothetical protein